MEQQQQASTLPKTNPNPNQKVVIKTNEFVGRVIEVHSGDTLTIQSIKFGTTGRFCLTNLRAPQMLRSSSKPYAFEAKEFLRKWVIGKEVQVKMEYEKSYTVTRDEFDSEEDNVVQVTEEKTAIFAMVSFEEKQLAVEVVSKGFASVQKPYSEEEQSKLYEELMVAEDQAKKKNLGIHSTGEYKGKVYRDLSDRKNQAQAKNILTHLKDSGRLTGVVELVLNGSRVKVRVNEQNCYVMMVLQGVRCLPNDENFPGYDVWSNKALNYSKQHLLQRDVEIQIQKVDKVGVFQGQIYLNKKQDYAETLLSEGLAVSFGGGFSKFGEYSQVEEAAKAKKVGLWSANINLQGVKGDFGMKEVQKLNSKENIKLCEVIDVNEFYYQNSGNQLQKLEQELFKYDPKGRAQLVAPVKPKTPCIAKFSADGRYYRANIVREVQNNKNKFLVHFIDYGNYDEVHFNDIRKMPEQYLKIPPQAIKCALAYVQGPNKKHACYGESIDAFMDKIWEKKLQANLEYKYGDVIYVILYLAENVDLNSSVNQFVLKEGVAIIDPSVELPLSLENWKGAQEKAAEKRLGVWEHEQE